MINFNDKRLIEIHGDWVRVQVAFYDFLFTTATNVCPSCFNEKIFKEGSPTYDNFIYIINEYFPDQNNAWFAFIEHELNVKNGARSVD